MESSNRPLGLLKGRYVDRSSQRDQLRFPDIESLVENEDWIEASIRYIDSVKATRANEGRRSQPRRMGTNSRRSEAGLQSNVAVDDEQTGGI